MGYAPNLKVTVYWDAEGADLYTPDGVYMFTCAPAPLASKTYAEATPDGLRALGHHIQKGETYDAITEEFVDDVIRAKAILSPNYLFNIRDNATKEDYNALHEQISAAEYERGRAKLEAKKQRARERERKKADQVQQQAVIDYHKNHISDLSKYIK